jgi:hypothetical protein
MYFADVQTRNGKNVKMRLEKNCGISKGQSCDL